MSKTLEQAARELLWAMKLDPRAQVMDFGTEMDALRAALAAETVSVPASDFENVVEEFLQDYVFEGDEGAYTPNEQERLLLADFGHGLIALMEDSDMLAAHNKERNDDR